MLDQALAVEGAEVGLGVADVDREEHGAIIGLIGGDPAGGFAPQCLGCVP